MSSSNKAPSKIADESPHPDNTRGSEESPRPAAAKSSSLWGWPHLKSKPSVAQSLKSVNSTQTTKETQSKDAATKSGSTDAKKSERSSSVPDASAGDLPEKEPIGDDKPTDEAAAGEPNVEEPKVDEPTGDEPTADAADASAADERDPETQAAEKAAAKEAATDKPAADKSRADKPTAEKTSDEKPSTSKPSVDKADPDNSPADRPPPYVQTGAGKPSSSETPPSSSPWNFFKRQAEEKSSPAKPAAKKSAAAKPAPAKTAPEDAVAEEAASKESASDKPATEKAADKIPAQDKLAAKTGQAPKESVSDKSDIEKAAVKSPTQDEPAGKNGRAPQRPAQTPARRTKGKTSFSEATTVHGSDGKPDEILPLDQPRSMPSSKKSTASKPTDVSDEESVDAEKTESSKGKPTGSPRINIIRASEDRGTLGPSVNAKDFEDEEKPAAGTVATPVSPFTSSGSDPSGSTIAAKELGSQLESSKTLVGAAPDALPDIANMPKALADAAALRKKTPVRRRVRAKVLRTPVLSAILGRPLGQQVGPVLKMVGKGMPPTGTALNVATKPAAKETGSPKGVPIKDGAEDAD